MRTLSIARVRVLGVLALTAFGCGLISSDVTKLTFELPTKHYTFSADGWASMFPAAVAANNMKVPCGAGTAVTTCPSPLACVAGVCSLEVPVSVSQTMNLKMEVTQLSSVNSQSLADITLESMTYQVTSTADVAIPEIDLYLAPDGVTDPTSPQAVKFGTVAPIPAATNTMGNVMKTADADTTFIKYGMAFGTPFNFIAATTVVVPTGTTPTGMVTVTINGTVSAKLSL